MLTLKDQSELMQAMLAVQEAQAHLIDLMSDPDEIRRWLFILGESSHDV